MIRGAAGSIIVALVVVVFAGCSNDRSSTSDSYRVVEDCLTAAGHSLEDVDLQLRDSPRFRAAVDECGADVDVSAADLTARFEILIEQFNADVQSDHTCMQEAGFEIATYADSTGALHLEDFDSKYVDASNVDVFFDAWSECVDLPRSSFPSSAGFPTTALVAP